MNKVSMWLRDASGQDAIDKILIRCEVAAGEIDRLQSLLDSQIQENEILNNHLKESGKKVSLWKKLCNILGWNR